jgi:hypothetical protein
MFYLALILILYRTARLGFKKTSENRSRPLYLVEPEKIKLRARYLWIIANMSDLSKRLSL